jgi:hypothetical protein
MAQLGQSTQAVLKSSGTAINRQQAVHVPWHVILHDRTRNGGLCIGRMLMMPTSFAGVPPMW